MGFCKLFQKRYYQIYIEKSGVNKGSIFSHISSSLNNYFKNEKPLIKAV
jgi:hypothetical protein